MKKVCPVCSKKPRRRWTATRWTRTCKNEKCRKLYYYLRAKSARPKEKIKCNYCKKTFTVFKDLKTKRYTCGKSICVKKYRLDFLKAWKKQNPLLVLKQKQRWKARRSLN